MQAFKTKRGRQAGQWLIEHSDVGQAVLLAGGEEQVLQRHHVGMLYVVDASGDRLETAPQEEQPDEQQQTLY